MLFHPNSEKNKFGYFQVGPVFRSYSLFESMEYKLRTGNEISFNFNDEFFSAIDWTQEPPESLKDLYAERCRQLRDKYDYLILSYSGGADSHNILSTFAEYGIPLDEVITHHSLELSNCDKSSPIDLTGEIFDTAIPEFNRLKPKLPGTILRVIDKSDLIKKFLWDLENTDLKFDYMYYNNNCFSPATVANTHIQSTDHYKRITDSGKSICFIEGVDKPMLSYYNKQWSFKFTSRLDSITSVKKIIDNHPWDTSELFYWAPESWKIIAKQAHAVKNFFKQNPNVIKTLPTAKFLRDNPQLRLEHTTLEILGRVVPTELLKKIIYPYWRDDFVNHGKAGWHSTMIGNTNGWYLQSVDQTPGAKWQLAGVKKLADMMGHTGHIKDFNDHIVVGKSYYF